MKKLFGAIYKLIAVIGIGVFFLPLVSLFLGGYGDFFFKLTLLGIIYAAIAVGYCMSALFALAVRYKRPPADSVEKTFHFGMVTVPAAAAAIIAILSVRVFDRLLFDYAELLGGRYDQKSFLPYLGAAMLFVIIVMGAVTFFLPVARLINQNTVTIAVPLFLGEYIFLGDEILMISVAAVYFFASAVILNQYCISRNVFDSVSDITSAQRGYNMGLSVAMGGIVFPIFLLVAIVVVGLTVAVKIPIFLIAQQILAPSTEEGRDDAFSDFDTAGRAGAFDEAVLGGSPLVGTFFALFCIICLGTIIFFGIKKTVPNFGIIEGIKDFFRAIADYFMWYFGRNRHGVMINETVFYKDEETALQDAVIAEYDPTVKPPKTYKDFYRVFSKLETADKQISYAYSALRSIYNDRNLTKKTDTPRETEKKLTDYDVSFDIELITKKHEKLFYACHTLTDSEITAALGEICRDLERKLS
ncbi:MAG: hypothetical protein IJF13_03675 [Clostridia bacterium]|nr:hypothetical protein [Clostridia bacterium]